MKYVVMTSRHHDGFSMFDSKASDFTSVKTAAHRDFVADYVKALRKAGLRVGLYYSPLDWRFPGFFFPDLQLKNAEAMRLQYHRQVEELLSNYGPIDVLWFDGGGADWLSFGGGWSGNGWALRSGHYQGRFSWQDNQVHAMIRRLQPQVLLDDRTDMPADFHTREGEGALGDFDDQHPWELCTTLVSSWGWVPNADVKSLHDVIRLLASVAGRDGNLLLNVGPRPDGEIDPPQVQRLREIGGWLNNFGESIYETRGGPFLPAAYGASTHRDKQIYVHVLNWPKKGKLIFPAIAPKILRASILGGPQISFTQSARHIGIFMPPSVRSDIDTVVKLELDQPSDKIKPIKVKP